MPLVVVLRVPATHHRDPLGVFRLIRSKSIASRWWVPSIDCTGSRDHRRTLKIRRALPPTISARAASGMSQPYFERDLSAVAVTSDKRLFQPQRLDQCDRVVGDGCVVQHAVRVR